MPGAEDITAKRCCFVLRLFTGIDLTLTTHGDTTRNEDPGEGHGTQLMAGLVVRRALRRERFAREVTLGCYCRVPPTMPAPRQLSS